MDSGLDRKADRLHKVRRRDFLRGAAVGAGATIVTGGLALDAASHFGEGAALKPVGFSRARLVPNDPVLPKKVDVAIIGGGYIGAATALALAERGVSVALFEKGVIAGESSGRSGGLVECALQAPEKLELIEASKQAWRGMKARTGEETGYMERGTRILSAQPEVLGMCEGWINQTRGGPNGGARMISGAEARAMASGTIEKLVGGMVIPTDATAEPVYAGPAMAIGARKRGATIHQFCAVRGVERSGGRVSAVITERGRVEASTVVVTGGVWAPMLADQFGLDLPVLQCFAKAMSLLPFNGPDSGSTTIFGAHEVGWRKQFDGGYVIWEFAGVAPLLPNTITNIFSLLPAMRANSAALNPRFNPGTFWRWLRDGGVQPLDRPTAYEKTRIYEPEPWAEGIDTGFRHLQETMPVFRWGPVRERWAGAMTTTPDNMPILSTVDSVPGLVLGTGFFYGLTMGAGAGSVLADIATGARPAIDIRHYRYNRFTDGSELGYYA